MDKVRLAIACDHAGFELKQGLIPYLANKGYEIEDFGTYSDERVDYPDFVHPLATKVEKGEFNFGIILCGSGNGVNMVANKHQGVRSALCWNKEIARLARLHNDANICALPSRFMSIDDAKAVVDVFLITSFEGGRHEKRVNKIPIK